MARLASPRLLTAVLVVGAALALAACGDDDGDGEEGVSRGCSAEPPSSAGWEGEPEARGKVNVAAFNAYLAEAEPPVSTSPCDAGRVLLHLDRPLGEGVTVDLAVDPPDAADATVTVTLDHLPDDSVAARRWTLEFEPGEGEEIALVSAEAAYRCQPGRGQQRFAERLCL